MDFENEIKQLRALVSLLEAKSAAWTEINFHRGSSNLERTIDSLLFVISELEAEKDN